MAIGKQIWSELITVDSAIEAVDSTDYSYLKLQRYLFDRAAYQSLLIRDMIYERGHNAHAYHAFEFKNQKFTNVLQTTDIIINYLNGPVIVAIHENVRASEQAVVNAVNRAQILPQRDTSRL